MAKVKEKQEEAELTPAEQAAIFMRNKDNAKDIYNDEETIEISVPSGSLTVDLEIGGAFEAGVQRFCGPPNSGKTPWTIQIMNNFMDTVPKSMGCYIFAEARLSKVNQRLSKRPFVSNPSDWSKDNILVYQSNIYESVIEFIKSLVNNNPGNNRYCFVFDSVDALVPRGDIAKDASESARVAGPAALSKKFFNAMNLPMVKRGHLALLISHMTSEVKIDPYARVTPKFGNFSGGNAALHYAQYIFEAQPRWGSDTIFDNPAGKMNDGKSKPIGHWTKWILRKTGQEGNKDKTISFPVRYGAEPGRAIWVEYEIASLLLMWEMVKKKGSWLELTEELLAEIKPIDPDVPVKVQGERQFCDYLLSNPSVTKYLYQKFSKLITGAKM